MINIYKNNSKDFYENDLAVKICKEVYNAAKKARHLDISKTLVKNVLYTDDLIISCEVISKQICNSYIEKHS